MHKCAKEKNYGALRDLKAVRENVLKDILVIEKEIQHYNDVLDGVKR